MGISKVICITYNPAFNRKHSFLPYVSTEAIGKQQWNQFSKPVCKFWSAGYIYFLKVK